MLELMGHFIRKSRNIMICLLTLLQRKRNKIIDKCLNIRQIMKYIFYKCNDISTCICLYFNVFISVYIYLYTSKIYTSLWTQEMLFIMKHATLHKRNNEWCVYFYSFDEWKWNVVINTYIRMNMINAALQQPPLEAGAQKAFPYLPPHCQPWL